MQDWKNGAVTRGIQKFIGVPAGSQRSSLGFTVAHNAAYQQIRVVERGAKGVSQRVTQFAALVDGAWSFWRDVAWNSSREGKLLEQLSYSFLSLRNAGINLAIGAFQIRIGHQTRSTMAGTGHVDDIEILLLDQAVQMDVNKIQSGRCAPMPQEPGLDVFQQQRLAQQGIGVQVNLPDRKVICSAPIRVGLAQLFGRQRCR